MPLPAQSAALVAGRRTDEELLEEAIQQSLLDADALPSDAAPENSGGITFASITRLGYAATGDPARYLYCLGLICLACRRSVAIHNRPSCQHGGQGFQYYSTSCPTLWL